MLTEKEQITVDAIIRSGCIAGDAHREIDLRVLAEFPNITIDELIDAYERVAEQVGEEAAELRRYREERRAYYTN